MAKAKRKFVCQQCGTVAARWQGQCEDCQAWNSIVEEAPVTAFSMRHDLA
ncbi:MAG: DNA repair protein RadA, partial [Sphingobium sp.]